MNRDIRNGFFLQIRSQERKGSNSMRSCAAAQWRTHTWTKVTEICTARSCLDHYWKNPSHSELWRMKDQGNCLIVTEMLRNVEGRDEQYKENLKKIKARKQEKWKK
jgi:hypothetical protein